jgi:hypothetical protein
VSPAIASLPQSLTPSRPGGVAVTAWSANQDVIIGLQLDQVTITMITYQLLFFYENSMIVSLIDYLID